MYAYFSYLPKYLKIFFVISLSALLNSITSSNENPKSIHDPKNIVDIIKACTLLKNINNIDTIINIIDSVINIFPNIFNLLLFRIQSPPLKISFT